MRRSRVTSKPSPSNFWEARFTTRSWLAAIWPVTVFCTDRDEMAVLMESEAPKQRA
jgi:hypothetical protein